MGGGFFVVINNHRHSPPETLISLITDRGFQFPFFLIPFEVVVFVFTAEATSEKKLREKGMTQRID